MSFKKWIFILTVVVLSVSVAGVFGADYQENTHDLQHIMDNYNDTELTGCCSVMLQLDGNNSIMSFRRDAESAADIYIEKIDWNGTSAIKQYKTEGDYFCQVIITHDGWMIGFGGIDDGADNQKTEQIARSMINDNNTISEDALSQIQKIKQHYKLGHFFIKAPNGNYGIATATTHFTDKLEPGEYASIPNRESFYRNDYLSSNVTDKIGAMTELAASDEFGLTRRDITVFYFHSMENDTHEGNVTEVFVSNDDGSMFNMNTRNLVDNVYFNQQFFSADQIPIAPNYESLGNITFMDEIPQETSDLLIRVFLIVIVILIAILFYLILQYVKKIRRY